MDNQNLDAFVAGQTLLDVGGQTTTGLDFFVAGRLYEAMESSGPADAFVGEAGGALVATTVAALRSNLFEAGGALVDTTERHMNSGAVLEAGAHIAANTFAIVQVPTTLHAGGGASHTVTIKGGVSAVTDQAGGALSAVTIKYVASDVIPGGLMLLGVGS